MKTFFNKLFIFSWKKEDYRASTNRIFSRGIGMAFGNAISRLTGYLIWEQNEEELTLYFMDTGTHSDLFK